MLSSKMKLSAVGSNEPGHKAALCPDLDAPSLLLGARSVLLP